VQLRFLHCLVLHIGCGSGHPTARLSGLVLQRVWTYRSWQKVQMVCLLTALDDCAGPSTGKGKEA
jgi:hypothetical protein